MFAGQRPVFLLHPDFIQAHRILFKSALPPGAALAHAVPTVDLQARLPTASEKSLPLLWALSHLASHRLISRPSRKMRRRGRVRPGCIPTTLTRALYAPVHSTLRSHKAAGSTKTPHLSCSRCPATR